MADNARQVRHIRHLLQALVFLEGLHHGRAGKDEPIHPHLALTWQAPAVIIDTLYCDAVCYSHTLSLPLHPLAVGRATPSCVLTHASAPGLLRRSRRPEQETCADTVAPEGRGEGLS